MKFPDNWIPLFHLVYIFAMLIRPTHLCCFNGYAVYTD